MTAPPDDTTADTSAIIEALRAERDAALSEKAALAEALATRNSEFGERIAQKAATIDVLKVMTASPGDPQPVFDLIVRRATELCNGLGTALFEFDGGLVHYRASYFTEALVAAANVAYATAFPSAPTRGSISCRAILDREIVHIRDTDADLELSQVARELHKATLVRSQISIPLMRDGQAIGAISLAANDPGGFTDSQIELLKTFAEQAVIAITSAETYRALQERTADLQETLGYQTATGDVLKVIGRSTFDLQPVLDTVVETAARLCDADSAVIARREGELLRGAAYFGYSPEYRAWITSLGANPLERRTVGHRAVLEGRVVHVHDVAADPNYPPELIVLGKQRTSLGVPLLREGEATGMIVLTRQRVEPFTDRQIELVSTFADQAVIAIENTRLITEQREALERQTATAEVLGVINASPGNLTPVFDTILDKAMRLCEAAFGSLYTYDGESFQSAAQCGVPLAYAEFRTRNPPTLVPGSGIETVVATKRTFHVLDVKAHDHYRTGEPGARAMVDLGGIRTLLLVPLVKEGAPVGFFSIHRQEVRAFSDRQIELLENFAAQAVIAIDNARLLTEQREALEQQTATAEVLQVINASPGDLTPVFDTILEKARALCGFAHGTLNVFDGTHFYTVATYDIPEAFAEVLRRPRISGPQAPLLRGDRIIHIPDFQAMEATSDDPVSRAAIEAGIRTVLFVALRNERGLLGYLTADRMEVRPFSEKEIGVMENFAAQAVLAIENARLLDEIRQRQAELRTTFDNMGDGVAMFDADLRLAAWNRNFQQMIDLPDNLLAERPSYSDYLWLLAERGEFGTTDIDAELRHRIEDTDKELRLERVRPDGRVIEVRRNAVPGGGFVLIYSDITERKRSEQEIRAARDTAETALRELKTAQANLIQAEKMASLGQLTAGIAHEIKNPLNFVNNFAELSVDLLGELKDAIAPAEPALTEKQRAEVEDVSAMLTSNLEKITEHGKRADGIVKAMLEHSRGSSGERRVVDLNALIDEALNLAYHGARAQDQTFNITLERDFGDDISPIEVNPQDMTRVFLNIFSNGFYATTKRARDDAGAGFAPTLKVTTRDTGAAVEIRVRDNGTGIPADVRDRVFEPFVTTKPAGEGTGLGLSITYDIVTQQHGGTIAADSNVGEYSEFTIRLPRNP